MLFDAELSKIYWAEAVATAAYLMDRSSNSSIGNKTPEELWSGSTPSLAHLKIFDCRAYAHVPKELRQKLDSKGTELLFVGYCQDSKGYRLMDPETKKITRSCYVIFLENCKYKDNEVQSIIQLTENQDPPNGSVEDNNEQKPTEIEESDSDTSSSEDSEYIDSVQNVKEIAQPRRSARQPKPIKRDDYITYLTLSNDATDPESLEEAISSSQSAKWLKAMEEERDSLAKNGTWTLTDLPRDKRALDTKWIFKTKQDDAGRITRHKARLVVRGCSQIEGIDYSETYSPVVRYTSIRFLCALAAKYDLHMDQMNVTAAYLHGDIEEEIYVRPPEEFLKPEERDKVWRLRKSMCGLKQSRRSWNKKLHDTLIDMRFKRSKANSCVYFKREDKNLAIIAIYVDDLLLLTNNEKTKVLLKGKLSQKFDMKDLGEARYLLGMNITRDRKSGKIWLNQTTYIQRILQKFGMSECKPVSTPFDPSNKLSDKMEPRSSEKSHEMNKIPYREAIGSHLYAGQGTRPDITFIVNYLSRYMQNPGKGHWLAVKRVFRYLKGTTGAKLEFSRKPIEGPGECVGYCDADWANDADTRHSITGSIFMFQGGPVAWQSKKQGSVALSTTEAEYIALSATCQEALWLRTLVSDLEPSMVASPTVILNDNKRAIELSRNSGYRPKMKHIDIRYHFIRERIDSGDIKVDYVPSERMTADILTKGLFAPKFKECAKKMGLIYP